MSEIYTPFGPDWIKEVSRIPKKHLIEMLRKCLIKEQEAADCIANNEHLLTFHPVSQPPECDTTVIVGFADGDTEHGFLGDGGFRSVRDRLLDPQPVAWADAPSTPDIFTR